MGLAIYLRKRETVNKFRELLIGSINTGLGDKAIICSGFFQENFKKGEYKVTDEGDFGAALIKNKIELTTVGIHNNAWLAAYRNFIKHLQGKGLNNINARISRGFHWHAKIYILKKDEKPIFAIIGSSNMTRNAFGVTNPFNFESDVVIWLDGHKEFDDLINKTKEELNQNKSEVIFADYDSAKNFGLSIDERLKQLVNDIDVDNTELLRDL